MHDLLRPTRRAAPLVSIGLTALGIVLALAPVGLWVAWTPFVFAVVVSAIAVCAALLVILHDYQARAEDDRRVDLEYRSERAVQDKLVEEIHEIFPLTYHHSHRGRARFRRAMERLRGLIR